MRDIQRDLIFRRLALSNFNDLLEMAESKEKIYTSAFYELISNSKVLETADSKAINIINEYNLITPYKVDIQIAKFNGNLEKIRKFIGNAKTCNIYYVENEELKNVNRTMFIEICKKLIDCVSKEIVDIQQFLE